MKVAQSRNKREGWYVGHLRGFAFRSNHVTPGLPRVGHYNAYCEAFYRAVKMERTGG